MLVICVVSSDLCPLLRVSRATCLAQVPAREHQVPDMVLDRTQHPTGTVLLDLSWHLHSRALFSDPLSPLLLACSAVPDKYPCPSPAFGGGGMRPRDSPSGKQLLLFPKKNV